MRLDLLKQLLAVPTRSRREDRMVAFLVEHVRKRGASFCGEIATDDWNNVFIRKGGAGTVPCVAAHIDTVQPLSPVEIVEHDGILFGVDDMDERAGIGGDDKAGVFVCLELLDRFDNIAVALLAAEEIGCEGAKNAPAAWFKDVGYVIEFDAPGRGLVSYTSSGERLFANDGEFIKTAAPVLRAHGLTRWQRHPFTDVMALRQRFDISCLNLSCGYHNWHRPDEYVVVEEVKAAVEAGEALLRALGRRSHPFAAGADDLAAPLFEVTGLQIA
jgi:putative aminopeptidase FrvX